MSGDPWCDGAGACLVLGLGALLLVSTGWVNGAALWLPLLLGLLTGGLVGLLALKLAPDRGAEADGRRQWTGGRQARSPEALLRERYARNELSREQYLTILEDLLKDRYVRGELDLDEYEARLDQLLREPGARATRS
jgi:uncharacterized membrane protein